MQIKHLELRQSGISTGIAHSTCVSSAAKLAGSQTEKGGVTVGFSLFFWGGLQTLFIFFVVFCLISKYESTQKIQMRAYPHWPASVISSKQPVGKILFHPSIYFLLVIQGCVKLAALSAGCSRLPSSHHRFPSSPRRHRSAPRQPPSLQRVLGLPGTFARFTVLGTRLIGGVLEASYQIPEPPQSGFILGHQKAVALL